MTTQQREDPFADPERMRAAGEHVLQVHHDLRRELTAVRAAVDDVVAGRATRADVPAPNGSLARHCLSFCAALEQHHAGEDGALGALEGRFPQLAPVLTRIRAEHRTVAAGLAQIRTLVAELDDGAGAERIRDELATLTTGLEEHFAYEERELLPAMGVPAPSSA